MSTTTEPHTADTETRLGQTGAALSRALARRLTRRSAVYRLGRYGVALALGRAGAALLDDGALAATAASCYCGECFSAPDRNCCGNDSVWCSWAYGTPGECPAGTCECGSWPAGPGMRNGDCCGECGGGSDCSCLYFYGAYWPSCCRIQNWKPGNCGNDCSNCSTAYYIKCRRSFAG